MSEGFVPASRLYDVESRAAIAHPAHQATDADVRAALEQREVRSDGGRLVESDECERCDESVPATQRLCPACAREVREARGGPL